MALNPHFDIDFSSKKCVCCGQMKDSFSYLRTKSFMYPTGYVDVCVDCLGDRLRDSNFDWNVMDKICQYLDIPFELDKFEELRRTHSAADLLKSYNLIYFSDDYDELDWSSYQEAYRELDAAGALDEVVPGLTDEKCRRLQDKWGYNYDEEALHY